WLAENSNFIKNLGCRSWVSYFENSTLVYAHPPLLPLSQSSFVKRAASAPATINSLFPGYQRSRTRLRLNELLATDRQAGKAQKTGHLHLEK
ncbi:hypothetical protein, partial [Pseudomonas syringae]